MERIFTMAKRCTRCGNFLMDDERFCTRCGENVSNIPPEGSAYVNAQSAEDNSFGRNDGYVSPGAPAANQASNQYRQPYTYAPPVYRPAEDEMTLGKWVLTIIVTTFFGLISLIFLFIWGFGDGPTSRKNYCKAMLIVELISIALGIVLGILFMTVIAGGMSQFANELRDAYAEYGQTLANTFASFIK